MLVYGVCRSFGNTGKHFRRPSRRGQKHRRRPEITQSGNHRPHGARLTGTRISVDHQNVRIITGDKLSHLPEKPVLTFSRSERELLEKTFVKKLAATRHFLFLPIIIPITASTGYISIRPRNISMENITLAAIVM